MSQPEQDPTATFHLDQEAAATETKTRDQVGWELHIQDAAATVEMKVQAARLEQAKADLRNNLSVTIMVATAAGTIWAASRAAQAVAGWFG